MKTLEELRVIRHGELIEIHTTSKSFLHHQVRNMVGALRLVGIGQWTKDDLIHARDAKDRTKGGVTAPPQGLYFISVEY
jgi:tRNA pseudouridine38-40 synthase